MQPEGEQVPVSLPVIELIGSDRIMFNPEGDFDLSACPFAVAWPSDVPSSRQKKEIFIPSRLKRTGIVPPNNSFHFRFG